MHPLVRQLEDLFLQDLQRVASEMRVRFPLLKFAVWEWPTETAAECVDFDIGIECLFPSASEDQPNNVALIIELSHLTSTPRIMGSVIWGHPSGHPEVEFKEGQFKDRLFTSAEWPEAKTETIEELRGLFPRLLRAFWSAVERGIPPS